MKKMYKNLMLLCCMAVLSLSNGVFAQDACADATAITVDGGTVIGDNTGTTDENDGAEPGCWGTDGAEGDVWFSVDGTGGLLDIETFAGTNEDTQIGVYDACDGTLVACDDDNGVGNMSFLTFCAELGTTYYIEVEGWNGEEGTFSISAVTSTATGDPYCSDETALNYNASPTSCDVEDNTTCDYPLANDLCADAIPIIVDGDIISASNVGAVDENDVDNGGAGEGTCYLFDGDDGDVWFSFDGNDGLVDIEVFCTGSFTDSQMTIYDACGGTQVACDDDGAAAPNCNFMSKVTGFCAEAGTTYYVEVEGYGGASGEFDISVVSSAVEPTTYCSDPFADQYVEFPEACWVEDNTTCTFCAPVNDVCSGAFPLAIDGTNFPGINVCAQPDAAPSCEFGSAFGVWYSFNSGANNAIELSLAASLTPVDSALVGPEVAVFSGTCEGLTQLFCASGAQNQTVISGLELSTTYYVLVWTDAALDQGEFDLSVNAGSAGCTDEGACNYDPSATIDEGCDFSCIGCLDEAAFNYDEDFTIDCGDCCALNDTCADAQALVLDEITSGTTIGATATYDAGVGESFGSPDAWFSFTLETASLVDLEVLSGVDVNGFAYDSQLLIYDVCEGANLAYDDDGGVGALSQVTGFCASAGVTYLVEVQGWLGDIADFTIQLRASDATPTGYCSDPEATNFNDAPGDCDVADDTLCDYNGCTDILACNYDGPSIEDGGVLTDDGSCCIGNCSTITLTDAFGDGWNGAEIRLSTAEQTSPDFVAETFFTGTVTNADNAGDFRIYNACIPDGCVYVQILGGSYPSELGITIETQDGVIYEWLNDAPTGFQTSVIVENENIIDFGMTGLCIIEGCTDETALNYDASATVDDGSCIFPAENNDCEGAIALSNGNDEEFDLVNYSDSDASCESVAKDAWYTYTPECSSDANINVIHDAGGRFGLYTGTCDDLTEIGCFTAGNQTVFLEAGVTYYIQAGGNPANVFLGTEGSVTVTEGICQGCIYDAADNYNPIAVIDDGSCEFPSSCSCPGDFNNDQNVSVVDLSGFLGAFGNPCE